MAAIPVDIQGTITTKSPKGGEVDPSGKQNCFIRGQLSLTGLHPDQSPPAEQPPIEPPPDPSKPWEAKTVWTPDTGWAIILVPGDDTLVPTPSKRR
jgi:hypothetical protein